MRSRGVSWATRIAVLVIALLALVHGPAAGPAQAQKSAGKGGTAAPKPAPQVRYGTEGLPGPVAEMREAILAAVRSGRIEELRPAIELNELKPVFSDQPVADPIQHLRQVSGDGEGREILAVLAELLDAGYIVVPIGKDIENNRIYVWPYFAEMKLEALTPAQEVELLRLVPPAALKEMRGQGRYTHWKLGIGADGVWHFLTR